MELQDQLCSLNLALRLKELNVPQKSLFYWSNVDIYPFIIYGNSIYRSGDVLISAFTVAELGELLPVFIYSDRSVSDYETYIEMMKVKVFYESKEVDEYRVSLCMGGSGCHIISYREAKEADARAKMLIYLIENKLIKF